MCHFESPVAVNLTNYVSVVKIYPVFLEIITVSKIYAKPVPIYTTIMLHACILPLLMFQLICCARAMLIMILYLCGVEPDNGIVSGTILGVAAWQIQKSGQP